MGATIVGTVMDVSLSARVITLTEPVEGFKVIGLMQQGRVFSSDGQEIVLSDILAGMRTQASGQPGESSALLASEVRLLEALPNEPANWFSRLEPMGV